MKNSTQNRREFIRTLSSISLGLHIPLIAGCNKSVEKKPNILFCIADDQSWQHASAYGDSVMKTPNFDRIAREGILFTQAYCAAPSCAPSRAGILTGQEMWRLEQGGLLFGALPEKFKVYPKLLQQVGYKIGYTGKGYSPANLNAPECWNAPVGKRYTTIKNDAPQGISDVDYAANFELFLKEGGSDKPFCFWYGGYEPHQNYAKGIGVKSGKKIEDVKVPDFLPDDPIVRSDILDYYFEIEWFDKHLGRMLKMLENNDLIENTLVVVTSDNGMPFPRAKTTLYDHGVRMPLAIRWGEKVKCGRIVDDFVSLTDLAPTFLDIVGLEIPQEMTGNSLKNILFSEQSGRIESRRDKIITAIERHVWCRPEGVGYPRRAIRTYDWLYIRNYEPDRWPAGNPDLIASHQGYYGDIDACPTKKFMMDNRNSPGVAKVFPLSFDKLPAEELYDVRKDPDQINNLANNSEMKPVLSQLRSELEDYQRQTADPRIDNESPWDRYPFYVEGYVNRK